MNWHRAEGNWKSVNGKVKKQKADRRRPHRHQREAGPSRRSRAGVLGHRLSPTEVGPCDLVEVPSQLIESLEELMFGCPPLHSVRSERLGDASSLITSPSRDRSFSPAINARIQSCRSASAGLRCSHSSTHLLCAAARNAASLSCSSFATGYVIGHVPKGDS